MITLAALGLLAQISVQSIGINSGVTSIIGGTDQAVCFDDGNLLNCNDAQLLWDKTANTLKFNAPTVGTANVINITNAAALGSAIVDYASIRVTTAPVTTTADGVAFGTYSTITNTTATDGTTAHLVGGMFNATDATTSRITLYGVEGRVDGRSTDAGTDHDYLGGTLRALFQGSSLAAGVSVIGAEAFCSITTDGSTPLASGSCIALYLPAGTGGATKYSIYAVDQAFLGGGALLQDNALVDYGSSADFRTAYNTLQTPDTFWMGTSAESGSIVITEAADVTFDFAHADQTNPTVFIHSANQSTTEWIGLTHDATNGVISTGVGFQRFAPAAAGIKVTGTAPAVTSCGVSPSTVTGSSSAGRFTWGSGGSDASCTLTFAVEWTVAPSCVCNNETNVVLVRGVATTTTLTCDVAVAATVESDVVNYICVGGA